MARIKKTYRVDVGDMKIKDAKRFVTNKIEKEKQKHELTEYQKATLEQKKQVLELGHQIKYNLYLNAKAKVFAALVAAGVVPQQAAADAHVVLNLFAQQDHSQMKELADKKKG